MSLSVDEASHYRAVSKTCYIANIAYLILRVFYLVLFLVSKLYIMAWIDAATILIYVACFLLIRKKKHYLYALICGNEFWAFIIASTLLIGFGAGFHFYLIGLSVVSFFTAYFSKTNNIKAAVFWAGLSVIIYLVLYFVSRYNEPYYAISQWLNATLFVTHVVVVFLFVVFYLFVFLSYALSLERRIMNESRTDELTQMNNRYALYDYFGQEEDKASKALALFDIDGFKQVNDVHGHVVGDFILKRVAEVAEKVLPDCFVCRYGGEEFIIVLDKGNAFERLEELRKSVESERFEYKGETLHVTITIGCADYAKDIPLVKWVALADEKMYSGKNTGKNKTVR